VGTRTLALAGAGLAALALVALAAGATAGAAPAGRPRRPAGWRVYADPAGGYTVYAPRDAPRHQDLPGRKYLKAASTLFLFGGQAGMGQIVVTEYVGPGAYDVEKGLDAAVAQAVAGSGGTMVRETKRPRGKWPARQFEFTAELQGHPMRGFGRAIGTGPRSIKAALALADRDRRGAVTKARAFVDSFRPR
jgi:hypothetical protein